MFLLNKPQTKYLFILVNYRLNSSSFNEPRTRIMSTSQMVFSRLGYSETLQVFCKQQRRRAQPGGAAGDGPPAHLGQQLQGERLQDHHSQGRHQQGGAVLRAGGLLSPAPVPGPSPEPCRGP